MTAKKLKEKVNFGFREVAKEEKENLVKGVFSSVAAKYDLMNDLMSFGLHRPWKNEVAGMIQPAKDMRILDVAGGTGDMAFRFLNKMQQNGTSGHVTVCDINEGMLKEGRKRAVNQNILDGIDWVHGNGEKLPFDDAQFDLYTVCFGIRNFTNIDKGLQEAFRVLKFGGRFICLEFSPLENSPISNLYDFYSFNVIPFIGGAVADNKDAYQYLVESIRKFPAKARFADMIKEAGFSDVKVKTLTFGVVAIHSAWKV